jgi:surface antigen
LRPRRPLERGQCTWYAWGRATEAGWKIRFDVDSGRHARNWWEKVTNAKKSDNPSVGAVLILDAWPGNPYGHVASVEKINPDGSFEITHANFAAGEPVAQREGVTVYRATCTKSPEGVSVAGGSVLPLRGFLVPIE